MNNFRSKSAVAAAVSLAIGAGAAVAATVNTGTARYSTEWAALAPSTGTQTFVAAAGGSGPTFVTGAAYITGDSATITITGAEFSTASSISVACDQTASTGTAYTTSIGTAGAVTVTATTATFTVAAGIPASSRCQVQGGLLTNASLTTANTAGITMATSVTRGTGAAVTAVDTGAAAQIGQVASQLTAVVSSAFNQTVMNWGATAAGMHGRVFGTGGTTTATTDDLIIRASMTSAVNNVTLESTTAYTLTLSSSATGGFNWLKNNGTATSCDISTGTNNLSVSGGHAAVTSATDSSCTSIVLVGAASGLQVTAGSSSVNAPTTIDAVVGTSGNFISAQTFTASGQFNYSVGTSVGSKAISLSLGSFASNGARVFIPYMPVGPGISQVLTVANSSATTGTATISAIPSTGSACAASNFGTVSLAANKVTSLSSALATGIAACYGSADSRTLALTVTVNAPAENVEVFSSYNVSGNRVAVVNSSNGRSAQAGTAQSTGEANKD